MRSIQSHKQYEDRSNLGFPTEWNKTLGLNPLYLRLGQGTDHYIFEPFLASEVGVGGDEKACRFGANISHSDSKSYTSPSQSPIFIISSAGLTNLWLTQTLPLLTCRL